MKTGVWFNQSNVGLAVSGGTECRTDDVGGRVEIEPQGKRQQVIIAMAIAFPKIWRPADDHWALTDNGDPYRVKKIQMPPRRTNCPDTVATNHVHQPIEVDQIVTKRPNC